MLVPQWKGFHENFGFQFMTTVPYQVPPVLQPVAVPETEFRDIPHFYPYMSASARAWWHTFMSNQFQPGQYMP